VTRNLLNTSDDISPTFFQVGTFYTIGERISAKSSESSENAREAETFVSGGPAARKTTYDGQNRLSTPAWATVATAGCAADNAGRRGEKSSVRFFWPGLCLWPQPSPRASATISSGAVGGSLTLNVNRMG